jgi:hypothetical protein
LWLRAKPISSLSNDEKKEHDAATLFSRRWKPISSLSNDEKKEHDAAAPTRKVMKVSFPHLHSFAKSDIITVSSVLQMESFQDHFNMPLLEIAFE